MKRHNHGPRHARRRPVGYRSRGIGPGGNGSARHRPPAAEATRESPRAISAPSGWVPREPDHPPDVVGRAPAIAQVAQGDRPVALGQALAAAVGDQVVVVVARRAQAEQRLQQSMHVRGMEQVLAARDQRHPLQMVVDRDRQMVARGHVLARQHHVAEALGIGRDDAGAAVLPGQRPGAGQRLGDIQAQRIGLAILDPPGRFGRVEARGRCRDSAARRMGRAERGRPARPRAGSGGASRSRDRPRPAGAARPASPGRRRDVPTAGAPGRPIRCRASSDPRRCRARIRAASAAGRCPRSAAGSGRPRSGPPRSRTGPSRHGPDADSRSGSARTSSPAGGSPAAGTGRKSVPLIMPAPHGPWR